MDPYLPLLPRRRIVVSMLECVFRGADYLSSFLLFFPVWIVGSIVVRPTDCLGGQLALHWSTNLLFGDMLKGQPSLSAARSNLL